MVFVVKLNGKLFDTNMFLVGTGVAQVTPNTEFLVLVANTETQPKILIIGQKMAVAVEHPNNIIKALATHGEVLVVAIQKIYCKQ